MKKVIRLTESDLMRIVKRVIKEQEKELDEDWVDTLAMAAGPLGAGVAALFGRDEAWKEYVKIGSALFGFLSTNTGKTALQALFNSTPVGIIKNMSIAAARGDAKNLTQAFTQASKYAKHDLSQLKNAAFKDMKSFGNLLIKAGIK